MARRRKGIVAIYCYNRSRQLDQYELAEVISWRQTASTMGFAYSDERVE